jgi:hypothetical protein
VLAVAIPKIPRLRRVADTTPVTDVLQFSRMPTTALKYDDERVVIRDSATLSVFAAGRLPKLLIKLQIILQ